METVQSTGAQRWRPQRQCRSLETDSFHDNYVEPFEPKGFLIMSCGFSACGIIILAAEKWSSRWRTSECLVERMAR